MDKSWIRVIIGITNISDLKKKKLKIVNRPAVERILIP